MLSHQKADKREFYKLDPFLFLSDEISLLDEHSTSEDASMCFQIKKPTYVSEKELQTSSYSFLLGRVPAQCNIQILNFTLSTIELRVH